MLQVSLYRYNPETDEAPYMQDFSVDTSGRDLMVLDVLELIKAEYDGSVTYRRSCREGVCGSDGLNMNGKNGLACVTPLSETVKGEKLVIRPLPGLPVIRDLVVDMSLFYAQYEKVQPTFKTPHPPPRLSDCSLQKSGRSSTGSMSAFYAPVAQPAAPLFGGTQTVLSAPRGCCRPIGFWQIAATPPQRSVYPN